MKLSTFVNSFIIGNGLSLYVACPLQVRELIHPTSQDANGKDLYPSIIINVPASLTNLRWMQEHEAKRKDGAKFTISLDIADSATFEVTTTKSGNFVLNVTDMEADLFSVKEQVMLPTENHAPMTDEEKAWLESNQKAIADRIAAKAAKTDDWA
jgi:hypothetical protein